MSAPGEQVPRRAVLFICHGSRQQAWREPFDQLVREHRAAHPDVPVELAFFELMAPGFDESLQRLVDGGATHVRVMPLFLAPGRHTNVDVPNLVEAARRRLPQVRFEVGASLAETPAIRAAIVAFTGAPGERRGAA